jgi:hypothetical protein
MENISPHSNTPFGTNGLEISEQILMETAAIAPSSQTDHPTGDFACSHCCTDICCSVEFKRNSVLSVLHRLPKMLDCVVRVRKLLAACRNPA